MFSVLRHSCSFPCTNQNNQSQLGNLSKYFKIRKVGVHYHTLVGVACMGLVEQRHTNSCTTPPRAARNISSPLCDKRKEFWDVINQSINSEIWLDLARPLNGIDPHILHAVMIFKSSGSLRLDPLLHQPKPLDHESPESEILQSNRHSGHGHFSPQPFRHLVCCSALISEFLSGRASN